jgi:hypothetical protein
MGNFSTCRNASDLSRLSRTLLEDQLKATGRFRTFENEQIAELRFGGEVTSCSVSSSQILFVTNVTVKFSVNITATDIVTSERIISKTVEGETGLQGVSFIGNFLSDTDFKKAIEDVFKVKVPEIAASKELVTYMTHAQGERATPRQSGGSGSTTPTNPPSATTSSVATNLSSNAIITTMFDALKTMDFATFNNSLSDNLLNLSSLANLSQYATQENKNIAGRMLFIVQSSQSFQDIYTVFDVLVVFPTKIGAAQSKSFKLGVMNTGGQFTQIFPNRANQGQKVVFIPRENPFRLGLSATFPIFNTSSDSVEQILKDYLSGLGISL